MKVKALKNKNLTLLLLGQFVSDAGGSIFEIALSLYVLDLTGSATKFASILALGIIPKIILYPFTGIIVDYVNKKKLIFFLDISRGIFLVIILLFTVNSSISLLFIYLITLIFGICESLFSPAMDTIIPFVCKEEQYEDAYAWNEMMIRISGIISPILGTIMYTIFGINMVILINGISFILSGISELFIHVSKSKNKVKINIVENLKAGLLEITNKKSILYLTIGTLITSIFIIPIFRLILPFYFKVILNAPNNYIGFYRSIQVSGGILGLMLVGVVKKRFEKKKAIKFISTARFILFFLFIGLGLTPILNLFKGEPIFALIYISILLFQIIILTSILNILLISIKLKVLSRHLLGRVTTTTLFLYSIGQIIGLKLFGYTLEAFPLIITMVLISLGALTYTLVTLKAIKSTSI